MPPPPDPAHHRPGRDAAASPAPASAQPAATEARDRTAGSALVAAQFVLMGVLAWLAAPAFLAGRAAAWAWLPGLAGLALGLAAVAANRPGNFNIRPQPREGGQLVQHGPYRWIRHPMYSAILLCAASGVAGADAPRQAAALAAAVLLLLVLWRKSGIEERALLAHHAGYAVYRGQTRRFVPWLL